GRYDGTRLAPVAAGDVGISLTEVTLGLALMTEVGTTTPRSYVALQGSGAAHLVGMGDLISLDGTIAVQVNTGKTSAGADTDAIDFTRLATGMLRVATGSVVTPTVDLAYTGRTLRAYGAVTLSLGQFAYVTGSFGFEKVDDAEITTETTE